MQPRSYPSPPGWAWQIAGKASKGGGLLSPGSCAYSPHGSPRGGNNFFPPLPQSPTQAPRYTWKAAGSPGLPKSHTHHQRHGRGLMSTFLKALRMTKDIPEGFKSEGDPTKTRAASAPPPRSCPHHKGPRHHTWLARWGLGRCSCTRRAQTMTTPHPCYLGRQGPLLSHLTDQEIEAGK